MKHLDQLTKCNLFASMSEDEIQEALNVAGVKEQEFKRGDLIALQDEICNRLIILTKGSVKAEMSDPSGKMVKIEDISAPSPIAILFLFGPNNRFPVQVTAREDVSTMIIAKQSILQMLQSNKQLLSNYLDISAIYASTLRGKLHLMSFRTIRQKLAIYFLDLSKQGNLDTVTLDRTQKTLAEYFGVSRPSLSRELSKMQEDGLILINKKEIKILQKNEFIKLTQFN